jgi:hypothetical protein
MFHEWGNLKQSADLRKGIIDAINKIENVNNDSPRSKVNPDGRGIAGAVNKRELPQMIAELKNAVKSYVEGVTAYSGKLPEQPRTSNQGIER